MGRRHSDKVISKEQILNLATKEFIEQGFHGARMENIAKTGRFNKAMIYYHFKDKEAIYEEVLKYVILHIVTRLNAVSEDPDSMEDLLSDVFDTYAGLVMEKPDFVRLAIYELMRGGPVFKKLHILKLADVPFNPINGRIYKYIQRQMKEGKIIKMDVFQLMLTIIGQIITTLFLVYMKDFMKDLKLPLNPELLINGLIKNRKKFIVEFTMKSIAIPPGGKK